MATRKNSSLMPAVAEKVKVPIVDITAAASGDIIPGDDEVDATLRSQGLVRVTSKSLRQFRELGVRLNSLSVLQTEQGGIFIHRSRMEAVQAILADQAEKAVTSPTGKRKKASIKNLTAIARNVALLGGKITDAYKLALDTAGVVVKTSGDDGGREPKRKSFAPGTLVQINVTEKSQVTVSENKVVASPPPSS